MKMLNRIKQLKPSIYAQDLMEFVAVVVALVMILIGLVTLPAHAGVSPETLDSLTSNLFTLLAIAVSAITSWAVHRWGRGKTAQERNDIENLVDKIVLQAVALAEERGADAVKRGIKDKLDKQGYAVQYVLERVPKLDRKEAMDRVDAMVARVYGLGATGNKTAGL